MESQYFENFRQWAYARNITQDSTPARQFSKLFEELGELGTAIAESNYALMEDAIGDIAVVLTVMAEMDGFKLEETYLYQERPDSASFERMTKSFAVLIYTRTQFAYSAAVLQLKQYTKDCTDLKFEECLAAAWNQIKDRKGKLINGIFVKE